MNEYDIQPNKARFIYTMSLIPKYNNYQTGRPMSVRLTNGFFFSKVSKSDDRLIYTELDMTSILRTILFTHVFKVAPCESIQDIIYNGQVTFPDDNNFPTNCEHSLSILDIRDIVDSLLGAGFCSVVSRPLKKVYSEYKHMWRYYTFGQSKRLPSALDFVHLYRFVNAPNYKLSAATEFVLSNGNDHKLPLQGNIKNLPL